LHSSLAAQITARPLIQIERPSRFTIGGGFVVSQPKGEFAENIDNGFGIDAYGLFRLDPTGVLSLRADLGGSQYGSETLPAGYIYGGASALKSKRRIRFCGRRSDRSSPCQSACPPLCQRGHRRDELPDDLSRRGTDQYQGETFASTENQSDNTRSWIFGGGVYFPFTGRLSMMAIDVGAKYFTGGNATYLREGSIRDNPTEPSRSFRCTARQIR
jgi:hypothetical protein